MTPKAMKIWIVEDEKNDADKAFQAIKRAIPGNPGEHYKVFWDETLQWGAELTELPLAEGQIQVCMLDHMPDIVVLDLLDKNLQFAAGKFYEKLRKEERRSELPAAFVIMWSVKTGLPEVHRFVGSKVKTDRRLMFTSTKTVRLLEENLIHCMGAWREAQLL
jgi:hypothetical protein